MITLGLWDNFVGTNFMQASTLLHELGHNLGLIHGGASLEPNCKPNYQSSISYLYQVLGLSDVQGVPHINYSGRALPALDETNLNESTGFRRVDLQYLPRWYAPVNTSFLGSLLHVTRRDEALRPYAHHEWRFDDANRRNQASRIPD